MRRAMAAVLATMVLGPIQALCQGRPLVEIGTGAGLTILSDGGTITAFGVPGAGIISQPAIYASFFTPSGLVIEPSAAVNVVHVSGSTTSTVGLSGMVGKLFHGAVMNSTFAGVVGSLQGVSGGGTNFAVGGRVGYRCVLSGGGLAMRVEGGYRRWLRFGGGNEFSIGVGFGGIIHSSK